MPKQGKTQPPAPEQADIVVIGGVAAGMSAASVAKRISPELKITVLEKSAHVSYGACGMPYLISGDVKSPDDLVAYTADFFRSSRGIDVRTRHEATRILPRDKQVCFRNLATGAEGWISFGRLLFATGARPALPPIEGLGYKGVFTLRWLEDGIAVRSFIQARKPRTGVIIGGGYVGMEMAEALQRRGIAVTVVERSPDILGTMDPEITSIVRKELEENDVRLLTSTAVTGLFGKGEVVSGAHLSTGDIIPGDIAIIGVGVRANSGLAKEAGIKTCISEAICVNEKMQTSEPGIYAAGDCAESHHIVLKRPAYIPLGSTANKQGRVAGQNMAGKPSEFRGIAGTSVFKCFGIEVARTGISDREAQAEKLQFASKTVAHESRAGYYPGSVPITLKLTAEKGSGRILGAQMAGKEGVAKRIDVLATAISAGMSVDDLRQLDLSYAPPFAPVWDIVLIAAGELQKVL